uniref:flagellar biosynthetic protein FliO n=1 Tax=Luteimonas sp. 4-12 TaxID=2027406 RepID=UPI000C7B5327|nr:MULTISPECIES: flagellar biosynthetic protein FliO [Luteimonas]
MTTTAIGTSTVESAAATTTTASAPVAAPRAPTTATVGQPATPLQVGAHAPPSPGLGGAFIALLLVLGLILGMAWLLKRMPGSGFRQADGLRVVASIPLGAKERAAVVQVGDEQLLLGIGPGGVRTLHVLPQPLRAPEPVQLPSLKTLPDFKQLLAQSLRRTPR